jgi:hypothetical protein
MDCYQKITNYNNNTTMASINNHELIPYLCAHCSNPSCVQQTADICCYNVEENRYQFYCEHCYHMFSYSSTEATTNVYIDMHKIVTDIAGLNADGPMRVFEQMNLIRDYLTYRKCRFKKSASDNQLADLFRKTIALDMAREELDYPEVMEVLHNPWVTNG